MAVLHMNWWESVVDVASRTLWIRTINFGEKLLKFKIRMTVETMTMETWLNMHPSCFVSQLNLPAINMVMFHPSSKTKTFLHCNVFFPSLAKLISKAVILIYCVYFPFHSLLIPKKKLHFPVPPQWNLLCKTPTMFNPICVSIVVVII